MRIIMRNPGHAGPRVAVLGMFDGVHLGHQALLRSARAWAAAERIPLRVYTFDRHPLSILSPGKAPKILTTLPEKAACMARCGVDELMVLPFNRSVADQEPELFLEELRSSMDLRAVAVGWNYTFGRRGRGDAAFLEQAGRDLGFHVLIEPPATLADGTAISSTLVRNLLVRGETEQAAQALGRPYTLSGIVKAGKREGHKLGFPTANILPPAAKQLPAFGVYVCRMRTASESWPAVVNIGVQPTLPSGWVTVEAHALTANPALYGQRVRLTLGKRLREERKFDSLRELKQQIEKDRETALALLGMA